jgi:hypothetical protein
MIFFVADTEVVEQGIKRSLADRKIWRQEGERFSVLLAQRQAIGSGEGQI